jgi:hypothetical protein
MQRQPPPPPQEDEFMDANIADEELAAFQRSWKKQLEKDKIDHEERTGVRDIRPVGPCNKQEVSIPGPPPKKPRNNLIDGRKDIQHDSRKGKKQIDKHGTERGINRDSTLTKADQKCGCKLG